MRQLFKYFQILFLSMQLSRERLKLFTEDHIQKLTANNPGGIFTAILTAVTNAYTAYYGDLSNEAVLDAVKQGKTVAMNASRDAVEKYIREGENLIAYTYRDNPAVYQEFYPQGMTEYYKADLPTFGTIADRFKSALTTHAADFTLLFVSDYNTLFNTFTANRTAQLLAFGNLGGEREELATTKEDLAKQLTTNLLTIALQYVGDEDKADVYFNQGILNAAFAEADRKVTKEINPGELQNAFDNVSNPEVQLSFKNEWESDLIVGFMPDATGVPTQVTVPAGNEVTLNASEFGWTTVNKFLNVKNASLAAGKYTVTKL
jgi:hypothetical protein